uniref:G-protein coupled receptors family 1 profile domain-containing protein n=1 Tax=Timema shepardi TaxID=629360 RepID=A0A7R9ATD2_TIMSH|nr:unnamed protein product [Timema shepardi]
MVSAACASAEKRYKGQMNSEAQQYPQDGIEGVGKCRTSYTSVLTIVAFSMERYLAICHPLHSYTMSNLERAWKIIAFLWLLSLVSAVPFAVFTSVNYVNYPPGRLDLEEVYQNLHGVILGKNVGKTTLITPGWDYKPDLHVIGSPVHCDSDAWTILAPRGSQGFNIMLVMMGRSEFKSQLGVLSSRFKSQLGVLSSRFKSQLGVLSSRFKSQLGVLSSRFKSQLGPGKYYLLVPWIPTTQCWSLRSVLCWMRITRTVYVLHCLDSNNPVLESAFCAMLDENIPVNWPIYEMSSFIFFIVPMLVILVLYILMGLKIRSRTNQALGKRFSSTSSDRNRTWDSRTKSILRMLG